LISLAIDRGGLEALLGEGVTGLTCRPAQAHASHPLERVSVRVETGRDMELVLKGAGGARSHAVCVRPRLVRDALREEWAYASLLDPKTLGTPRFYGTLASGAGDDRLVLEAVPGHPLAEEGDLDAWLAAARWLARFHKWGAARLDGVEVGGRLLRQSPRLHARWLSRAGRCARATGQERMASRLEALTPTFGEAVARLEGSSKGIVHGEFYPSNILVEPEIRRWRVTALDWESVGVGPVILDLAALTMGEWDVAVRRHLWEAYATAADMDLRSIEPALHAARLVNAVQWLGWSPGWTPPAEHAREWIDEAEDAAARLEQAPAR
jgi:aminoglycoside phosphotransferase (APT) family kinase protein